MSRTDGLAAWTLNAMADGASSLAVAVRVGPAVDIREGLAQLVWGLNMVGRGFRTNLSNWKATGLGLLGCCVFLLRAESVGNGPNAPLPSDWIVRSWQTAEGLPQNTVCAMVQTRNGYLWLATGGGLARFDGSGFRKFGLENGLGSVEITSLAEARDGTLWVGTRGGGLSRWDHGRFVTYSQSRGMPAATVEVLAADQNGSLWIGTAQGLVHYRDGIFRPITEEEGLPQKQVQALLQDSKGTLWVSVLTANLFRGTNGRFVPLPGPSPRPERVYELFEDSRADIWAGSEGNVWRLHDGVWKLYGQTNGLPAGSVQSFVEMRGGPLCLGIRHQGLYWFNGNGFERLSASLSFSGDDIRELVAVQDGSIWLGTETSGLKGLLPRTIRMLGEAGGLGRLVVRSVAEDTAGVIWAASQVGGIYRLGQGQFSNVEDRGIAGVPTCYTSLATSDGSVWVAGESCAYQFREGRVSKAYLEPPVQGNAIRAMCEDGEAVWLGTYYSALLKVARGEVQVIADKGSFGADITSLAREAADTLWIGTSGGLYRWEHGRVRAWRTADGLLSDSIRSLHRDPDGTLWIGTLGGGLARLRQGRLINITSRQGLADDVISQILADDFGRLWLGSNRGIMRLDKSEVDELANGRVSSLHVARLGRDEGMANDQCVGGHSPTAIKTRSGRLLFPTVGGLVETDPRNGIEAPAMAPRATIDEVKVQGKIQSAASKLVIPPGAVHVEISYAAPNLCGGSLTRFRFRLDPLEKAWVNPGARRTAVYALIPPGDFVFQVTASDSSGNWNDTPASLAITVQPHRWQALWLRWVAASAACGAAGVWYLRRVRALERKRAAQETFTHRLLASQEQERKRLASELHDGLGQDLLLIKNRLGLLATDGPQPTQVARQLAEISKDASRALADVRAISHALRPAAIEQVGLTKAIEWMVRQVAETSSTKFSTELENIDGLLSPDMEINLYRIVQESLNNVLKHARAAQVIVELKRQTPGVWVSVFDNGCGFSPDGELETKPGFGLAGIRQRAKVLGGQVEVQSARGKGTRITLTVPLPDQEMSEHERQD